MEADFEFRCGCAVGVDQRSSMRCLRERVRCGDGGDDLVMMATGSSFTGGPRPSKEKIGTRPEGLSAGYADGEA